MGLVIPELHQRIVSFRHLTSCAPKTNAFIIVCRRPRKHASVGHCRWGLLQRGRVGWGVATVSFFLSESYVSNFFYFYFFVLMNFFVYGSELFQIVSGCLYVFVVSSACVCLGCA